MINWDLLALAVELHKRGSDKTAEAVLADALDLMVPNSDDVDVPIIDGRFKDYGVNGYTDSNDPRQPSAQRHSVDRPHSSIHTTVHQMREADYRVVSVEAYGEPDSRGGGRHVAYVTTPIGFNGSVVLATGYKGIPTDFDDYIKHVPGQEVVIDGKFSLPNLGPLAIFLMDGNRIVSDVVGNLGLPDGDHMSFKIVFE